MKSVIITLSALVLFFAGILAYPAKPQSIVVPSAGGTTTYPATVAGTVNSGGIPCFTSSTQVSSSSALTANVILQGGGAGVCPGIGNGDFTIDSTAHTLLAGASGLVDLSAEAATGLKVPTGSGFEPTVDGQIAFNSAQHAYYYGSNGTPLAVASAGTNTTATACTNGAFITISAIAAPTCENKKAFVTGSDYTNATTGATNVTGLSFSLLAGVNYAITCNLIYQGSVSTASMILNSTGPASPTEVNAQTIMDTTTGASAVIYSAATDGTTFGFNLGPTAITTTATDLYATLVVNVINVNSGTWQLTANSNGTGTITIRKGSSCTRW